MKNNIFLPFIFFLTLCVVSCKKEKDPAVIGKWSSISNYTEHNGVFGWSITNGFSELITFDPDARFITFLDVPTGGGNYVYDSRSAKIDLHFEADYYGTIPATITYQIEELTDSRLVVANYSSTGNLQFKRAYTRLD